MDGDGQMTSLGAFYVESDGDSWELVARNTDLNRDALTAEPTHTLAPLATDVESVDVFHRRALFGGRLVAGVGFDSRDVPSLSSTDDQWRLMAEWLREFE
jgi:hypothetical protein